MRLEVWRLPQIIREVHMASVMEVLTKTALAEMIKLVDDASGEFRLEMGRSQRENEALRSKVLVLEGELRAARGCGAVSPDSSLNIALGVKVCDEFREAQNSKVAGNGSIVAVEGVFDERLSAVLAQDEEYVPVEKKEDVPDSLDIKNESVDWEQVWSKSVLRSKDWLEEDLKMSQSQPRQNILLETICGSSGAATAAANGGEWPICVKEELHIQPCPAGDPEKGLRAELKQEPELDGQHFNYALPLLRSVDQGQEFPLGMVSEEHGWCVGSARVEESFGASVEAESTSVSANTAVGPLCKEEEDVHMQPCPTGDPEKGLRAKLKQEREEEPLTLGHPLSGTAVGLKIECAWSMATGSGTVRETPRRHRESLEDGGGIPAELAFPLGSSRAPCEASFDTSAEAKSLQGIEGQEECVCTCCRKTFPDALDLQTHEVQQGKGNHFHHLECGKALAYANIPKRHQLVHTGEKPHRCDECGKCFTEMSRLKTHLRVHTGEKPYSCDECGRSFARLDYLKTHKRVHTGEEPYSCDECGKGFTQLVNLKNHQRVHTGEKPHSCDECGKGFAHLHNLKTHQRVHTGEKPYSCDECGMGFSQLSSLKTHKRLHTGEKPHSCDECGKDFVHLHNLKTHQRVHTGEKPYSCDECGKCFTQLSKLKIHQRIHTGKGVRLHSVRQELLSE